MKDKKYESKWLLEQKTSECRIPCSRCGWLNKVLNRHKRVICKRCGYYVYLDKKDEFKKGVLEALKHEKVD